MADEGYDEDAVTLRLSWLLRRWRSIPDSYLRLNNLSPAVGLLELSNALDFAANAWNAVPPPIIAKVFMAVGATGALAILVFASFDIPRARRNALLLRDERRRLMTLSPDLGDDAANPDGLSEGDRKSHLDMNSRELGNEVIDRLLMGILLGFGALTVGVGTYMAMEGANPAIFLASNIITGYVGNVPAALYGILNMVWSVYGWRRAHRHATAAAKYLRKDIGNDERTALMDAIKIHTKRVKRHAVINGISGIAGGAGSLMTASTYIKLVGIYGYFILLPTAISSVAVNVYWRRGINYDRNVARISAISVDQVLQDAGYALKRQRLVSAYRKTYTKDKFNDAALRKLLIDLESLSLEQTSHQLHKLQTGTTTVKAEERSKIVKSSSIEFSLVSARQDRLQIEMDRLNRLLDDLRSPAVNSEKRTGMESVVAACCDSLVELSLFPRLCERLANSREFAPKLLASARDQSERKGQITVNEAALRQRIATKSSSKQSTEAFLELVSNLFITQGDRQARGRVRYYSEFLGCILSCTGDCG